MTKKTISVIIPTFNRKDTLTEAVNSVFAQTLLPDEIIIVDCGSQDGTKKAFYDYNEPIKFFETKIPGASAQRNFGISNAKGSYIAFLDDDDIWHPEKLNIQIGFLEQHPEISMISSGNIRIGYDIKIDRPKWILGDLYKKLFMKSFISTPTVLVKREVFDRVGCFNENYKRAEDYDLWLRISRCFHLAHTKTPLTWIRKSKNRLSDNKIDLRNSAIKVIQENYDPEKISQRKLNRRISGIEISLGRRYIKSGNKQEGKKQFLSAIKRYPYSVRSYRYLISTMLK
ncbi:MAG: glycosyltransferase [Deltaproteobacteria bacterium]|nr:glycosyltransferase [Deltaproteobacteria bacterium]